MATATKIPIGAQRAVLERIPPQTDEYGKLRRGDTVKVIGKRGDFRFLSTRVDDDGNAIHLNLIGPLGQRQRMRAFAPESIQVPSTRALNLQRKRRET